jgi:hypothetical protein
LRINFVDIVRVLEEYRLLFDDYSLWMHLRLLKELRGDERIREDSFIWGECLTS